MSDFDPELERADEVEDYTGEVPRPTNAPVTGGVDGFGDGDLFDPELDAGGELSPASVLDDLIAERDQFKDLAMRNQAEFENFRKRAATQQMAEVDRATGRLAEALLPVLDAAEAAYLRHPDEVGPLLNVLLGELRKHGLETLDLTDAPFDPEVAEAVAHEAAGGGEVLVAEVLRSGYRWRGKTLRPAMVRTKD